MTKKKTFFLAGIIIAVFCLIYYKLLFLERVFTHDSIIWYGIFHYYIDSISNGSFPYWNPYMLTGTIFYPDSSLTGLLDPSILLVAILKKIFSFSHLAGFVYFRLFRLWIFVIGAFYLFKYISRCNMSAMLAAGILLFSIAPGCFRQYGLVDNAFLTPFALYFLLRFLEDFTSPKRYLYFSILMLITGISMNIYIPAYYLFNLIAFLVVLVFSRTIRLTDITKSFQDKKLLSLIIVSVFFVLLMLTPSFMVWLKDASKNGELFPMQRIIQKNRLHFKKMMASEIGDTVFSEKFTGQQGVFSSYGNLANLLYPDLSFLYHNSANVRATSKLFFIEHDKDTNFVSQGTYPKNYLVEHNLLSESLQYMGIIPFLFSIIGFMYHKSRFRYVALIMILLVSVNMLNFYGVVARPNLLQRVFNIIFPPLKMIEVREGFGSFFTLYLCMLLSMGLSIFFNEGFLSFIKDKYIQVIRICLFVIGLKAAIAIIVAYKAHFGEKYLLTYNYDLFVMFLIIFFAVSIYMYAKGFLPRKLFYSAVLLAIFIDLYAYNKILEEYVLQDGRPYYSFVKKNTMDDNRRAEFKYFRVAYADANLGYAETITKEKGAFSKGYNHNLFTTKRYYDYLTHVPPENQFILSGFVYPIVRFFPIEYVKEITGKKELLRHLATTSANELERYLYVEKPEVKSSDYDQYSGMVGFEQYEDAIWLERRNIIDTLWKFSWNNRDQIKKVRNNPERYLRTQDYFVEVKDFSPNSILIKVKNNKDGYLYYNDGWSKYWHAFDGGKEIPIEIANYNFKAVFLKEGEHEIRFVFNPWHYKFGLVAYYTGLLFSVAMVVFLYINLRMVRK